MILSLAQLCAPKRATTFLDMSDNANRGSLATARDLDLRLKRIDEQRWIASRYAPAAVRPGFVAVCLLHHELARAGRASEPMVGLVRLKWWYDAIAESERTPSHTSHELLEHIPTADESAARLKQQILELIEAHSEALIGESSSSFDPEYVLALACCCTLDPAGSKETHQIAARVAAGNCGATEEPNLRDIPAALWPAFLHVAARTREGEPATGLRARTAILWAALSGRL